MVCHWVHIPVMPDGDSDMKPDTFACLTSIGSLERIEFDVKSVRCGGSQHWCTDRLSDCEPALKNDPVKIPTNNLKLIGKSEYQWGHECRRHNHHFLRNMDNISMT